MEPALPDVIPSPSEPMLRSKKSLYGWNVCFAIDGRGVPRFDSESRESALLLAGHLKSSQRRCLRRSGFFVVKGKSGRRFRVWARRQVPVVLIDSVNWRPRHDPWLYSSTNDFAENIAVLPLADYLLELKLCLEAAEEYFLLTSNPNFERRQIEKNELLRKVTFTDWPLDEREARHWRAVADDLSSE